MGCIDGCLWSVDMKAQCPKDFICGLCVVFLEVCVSTPLLSDTAGRLTWLLPSVPLAPLSPGLCRHWLHRKDRKAEERRDHPWSLYSPLPPRVHPFSSLGIYKGTRTSKTPATSEALNSSKVAEFLRISDSCGPPPQRTAAKGMNTLVDCYPHTQACVPR